MRRPWRSPIVLDVVFGVARGVVLSVALAGLAVGLSELLERVPVLVDVLPGVLLAGALLFLAVRLHATAVSLRGGLASLEWRLERVAQDLERLRSRGGAGGGS